MSSRVYSIPHRATCTTPRLESETERRKDPGWALLRWVMQILTCTHFSYILLNKNKENVEICVRVCTYLYTHVCVYICTYTRVCVYINTIGASHWLHWSSVFCLQGYLLYRDTSNHSMSALKINPETLEHEGTVAMPGDLLTCI